MRENGFQYLFVFLQSHLVLKIYTYISLWIDHPKRDSTPNPEKRYGPSVRQFLADNLGWAREEYLSCDLDNVDSVGSARKSA